MGEVDEFLLNARQRILHAQYDGLNALSPELREQVEAARHRLQQWTFTSHYLIMDGCADIACSISAHITKGSLSEPQDSWSQTVMKEHCLEWVSLF